jgi:hypothetical protein
MCGSRREAIDGGQHLGIDLASAASDVRPGADYFDRNEMA